MTISTRAFRPQDLEDCLAVEAAAIKGNNHYMRDVIDYYTTTKGEMTVVEVDGKIAGIGKLTILFDGSAWLELLRVAPEYQRQGCGMAIYKRYLEQIEAYHCPAARMYTGVKNVASAALAAKNGLERGPVFHSMSLSAEEADAGLFWEPPMFRQLSGDEAVAELLPLKETYGFFNINQTYYEINEATIRGFASMGWVYGDGQGNALVAGARFQPGKALYIAAMKGKRHLALSYALNLMVLSGSAKLMAHFPDGDLEQVEYLKRYGFVESPSQLVVCQWQRG